MKVSLKNLNSIFLIVLLLIFNKTFSQSDTQIKMKFHVFDNPCIECDFKMISSDLITFNSKTDGFGYVSVDSLLWNTTDEISLYLGNNVGLIKKNNFELIEDYIYYNFNDISEDELEEIVIFATKSRLEDFGYKTVYNVDKDQNVVAISSSDLLRRVPGVSIGFDGTPSIRGSSNIQIKVNDKVIRNADPKTILSSISPIDIIKVEVILSPSVKDGGSGEYILHIITKDNIHINKSGYVNLGLGDKGSHLFTNYNTSLNKNILLTQSFSSLTYNNNTEFKNILDNNLTVGSGESKGTLYNYNANFTFSLENKSEINLSFKLLNQNVKNNELFIFEDSKGLYNSKNDMYYSSVTLSYNKKKNISNFEILYDFGWIPVTFSSEKKDYNYFNTNNKSDVFSSNIKFDYSYKFSRKFEIETGSNIQYDFLKGKSIFGKSYFKGDKVVSNIYVNNLLDLRPFSIEVGVGYNNYYYQWRNNQIVDNNLFLSFKGNYKIDITNLIYVAYNRSIVNPSNSHILPLSSLISPVILQKGNPNLFPVISNKLEFGYSNKSELFFFKTSPFFSYNRRVINTILEEDYISYLNLGKAYTFGVSNWITSNLFDKKLLINYGIDLLYKNIKDHSYHNEGVQLKNNLHLTFKIYRDIDLQFFGSFNTPEIVLFGKENSYTYSNFSIQKKIFNNKSVIAFSVDNPFTNGFKYINEIDTFSNNYKKEIFYKNRGIRLFFSYQFGSVSQKKESNFNNSNDFRTF